MTAAAALLAFAAALEPHSLSYSGSLPWEATQNRAWEARGSRRLAAEAGAARLRVASEPASGDKAGRALIDGWAARFAAQFEGEAAYPGMVTRRHEVPAPLRPRSVENGGRRVWIAPATARLTFGAGAEDLVAFQAVLSWRWCPGAKRAVELALFYPRGAFSQEKALTEEAAFSCAAADAR